MDETIEKLWKMRRKKARRFFLLFLTVSIVFLIISPWISMVMGLLLAAAAAYGLSPTMNLYRGFKSAAGLSLVSKEAAMEIYSSETNEVKTHKSQYGELFLVILLSMGIFIVSIILMDLGWHGLIL